ncbi:MAG: DUF2341 domain-containing protein [Candidatus Lokiarchaeota archaeon]|nr:DUF2341 domain-containing protein [Candidatus Lokiarchaeota archaeon]
MPSPSADSWNGNGICGSAPVISDFVNVKSVSISPATPVADYNVRLDLNATFDYAACQADGDDVQFFDDSDSPLPFWTEKWASGGDSIIWVKLPAAGTTSIKMAYGNATVGTGSDGEATFPLFDDFSGAAINASKWTVEQDAYSSVTIVSGEAHIQSLTPNPWGSYTGFGFGDWTLTHGAPNGMQYHNVVFRNPDLLVTRRADVDTDTESKKNMTDVLLDYI